MQHIEMKTLSCGFEHLRMLKLRYVVLKQELLNNLLANFFLLEQLFLEDCDTLSFDASPFKIYGPMNLDCLKISGCWRLKQLRVYATSLKRFAFSSNNDMNCLPRVTFELVDFHDSKFSSIQRSRPLLKHLDLKCIEFSIDWPQFSSLKTVTLDQVHLEEEDITVLLLNCLLLERLSIIRCDGLPLLSIIGPSLQLKQLTVMWCSHLKEIKICDVNLIQLEYHGDVIVFSLTSVSHLVSVEMEIYTNDDKSLTNVLSMLSRDVPRLETLIFYIEGGKVPESPPMFYNLKHSALFLGRYIFTEEFPWTTLFLSVSPFLENFHFYRVA
ncbi:uncharacterized protein A4U43_C04F2220 [Asparagus officinalis]|uniref:At1g61320/AtMIF1 LRR domain-containing protein n=1 Tax=Asparagus officinalis TaxID=4686 RepID=A0A5P1EXM5_ASPOF|nr:uncharacterized protein A4U43_C04F2220 [Asparagus officinalis]